MERLHCTAPNENITTDFKSYFSGHFNFRNCFDSIQMFSSLQPTHKVSFSSFFNIHRSVCIN